MAERPNATDCKSVKPLVQIQLVAPLYQSTLKCDCVTDTSERPTKAVGHQCVLM